jgi:hypothetical protein
VIRKEYKPNGAPDLRRWIVECDGCRARCYVLGSGKWFVPAPEAMPDYCPFCLAIIAAYLIERAFT